MSGRRVLVVGILAAGVLDVGRVFGGCQLMSRPLAEMVVAE